MSDLLEQVAKIEDWVWHSTLNWCQFTDDKDLDGIYTPKNPLTNDADAMPLLKKLLLKYWTPHCLSDGTFVLMPPDSTWAYAENKDLNTAICMAWVEHHGT